MLCGVACHTTGNRVWAYTPPRVQIPDSPPSMAGACIVNVKASALFFFLNANISLCMGGNFYRENSVYPLTQAMKGDIIVIRFAIRPS